MGRILLPPTFEDFEGPLIFLAGPIKGALNWQGEAINLLQSLRPEDTIASPRTSDGTNYGSRFSDQQQAAQIEWEFAHLERAMTHGVVLFWFAAEAQHFPERAYAQQTRVEFGDALRMAALGHARIVAGGEIGYPGLSTTKWRFNKMLRGHPFHDTLEATCRWALRIL